MCSERLPPFRAIHSDTLRHVSIFCAINLSYIERILCAFPIHQNTDMPIHFILVLGYSTSSRQSFPSILYNEFRTHEIHTFANEETAMNILYKRPLSIFSLRSFRTIDHIKDKCLIILLLSVSVILMTAFRIPCPLRTMMHICCPGCGMTRAVFCAMRLQFSDAFSYHWMFWSVPFLLLYFLYSGHPFANRKTNFLIAILLSFGYFVNWLHRLSFPI